LDPILICSHLIFSPVELMGYRIPTNSHIVPNLYAVHRNPDYFADPEEFRPERFIETSESGEVTVKRVEELMPFGVGRRVCLGKILAEREVFYAVASLLHTFELRPSGEELPSMEAVPGVTLTPKPFELKFVPRNENALDETKMNLRPDYFTINSRTYG
jgi:cytochrome P450